MKRRELWLARDSGWYGLYTRKPTWADGEFWRGAVVSDWSCRIGHSRHNAILHDNTACRCRIVPLKRGFKLVLVGKPVKGE